MAASGHFRTPRATFWPSGAAATRPPFFVAAATRLDRAGEAAYAGSARRGGRVVEGARLLSEYTAKSRIMGSNPILSATPKRQSSVGR